MAEDPGKCSCGLGAVASATCSGPPKDHYVKPHKIGPRRKPHVTDEGERIPPAEGSRPCDEYDPAGPGAGKEADGHPQCAGCGHPKTKHSKRAQR